MRVELINLGKHQKWVILAIHSMLCAQSYMLNYNIIPINYSLQKAYNLEPIYLGFLTWVGTLAALASYVPHSTMLLRLGIKWTFLVCATFGLIGLLIESFFERHLAFLYIGYFLCKFCGMGALLAYGEMVNLWFSSQLRIKVLLLISISMTTGYWASYRALRFFVNNKNNDLTKDEIGAGIRGYFKFMASVLLITSAIVLFAHQNMPGPEHLTSTYQNLPEDEVIHDTPNEGQAQRQKVNNENNIEESQAKEDQNHESLTQKLIIQTTNEPDDNQDEKSETNIVKSPSINQEEQKTLVDNESRKSQSKEVLGEVSDKTDQIYANSDLQRSGIQKDRVTLTSSEEKKSQVIAVVGEPQSIIVKDSVWLMIGKLLKHPFFLLLVFGAMLGSGTIGGIDVSLAVITDLFGMSESETLRLADADIIGGLIGKVVYLLGNHYYNKPIDELLFYLIIMHTGFFVYWTGITNNFYITTLIGKGCVSMGNAPLMPISMGLAIGYFKTIDPSLVLISTTTVGIVKEMMKAVGGTFTGVIMDTQTQFTAVIACLSYQGFCFIAFICGVILNNMLAKKNIQLK